MALHAVVSQKRNYYACNLTKPAVRTLWKQPGFSVVVTITLGLGIGATTAIFNVVHAVLLRPLPFAHPEELVIVRDDLTGRGLERTKLRPGGYHLMMIELKNELKDGGKIDVTLPFRSQKRSRSRSRHRAQ